MTIESNIEDILNGLNFRNALFRSYKEINETAGLDADPNISNTDLATYTRNNFAIPKNFTNYLLFSENPTKSIESCGNFVQLLQDGGKEPSPFFPLIAYQNPKIMEGLVKIAENQNGGIATSEDVMQILNLFSNQVNLKEALNALVSIGGVDQTYLVNIFNNIAENEEVKEYLYSESIKTGIVLDSNNAPKAATIAKLLRKEGSPLFNIIKSNVVRKKLGTFLPEDKIKELITGYYLPGAKKQERT